MIELKPDDTGSYYYRGIAYGEKGEFHCAIKDFTKAIELKPNFAEAYYYLGRAYHSNYEFDSAIENYTKAIELDSDNAETYCYRGVAWLYLQNWEKAKTDLVTAKDLGADISKAFYTIYRGFIENWTKMIEQNPNDAEAYHYRGMVWLQLQNWEAAKADLSAAKNIDFDVITAFHNDYENIADFEQKHNIQLPQNIAVILTPEDT